MIKKNKINSFLIILYFVIQAFFLIFDTLFKIFDNNALLIEFGFLLLIIMLNRKKIFKESKDIAIFTICIIISGIATIANDGGIGSILNIINLLIGFFIFTKIDVNIKSKTIYLFIFFIIFLTMVKYSNNVWIMHRMGEDILNPNTVALLLFLSFTIINSMLFDNKKKIIQFLLIVLFCFTCYSVYKCESRTILYAMFIYAVLNYVPLMRKLVNKKEKIILISMIILGVLIPFVYVKLYTSNISFNLPFTTKTLYTGREDIWNEMIKNLNNTYSNYLFGLGTKRVTNIGIINNYHNWFLGVIYTFGIMNFIIYFGYLVEKIEKLKRSDIKNVFITILFIGIFETAGLWPVTHFYLYFLLICDKNIYRSGDIIG